MVEKLRDEAGRQVVRKSYSFPTAGDRWRGMLRGTLFGTPKAERELENLNFLKQAGIPVIEPIRACVTRNAFGFVVDSHLLSVASEGVDLASWVASGHSTAELWASLGSSICRMHQVGFWHRGLAPRNVLVESAAPFHALLDPAKSKVFRTTIPQAARADDLLRLWHTLHQYVSAEHKKAFEDAYGQAGVSDPATMWPAIPKGKRASTERVLLRDEARFESS